MKKFLSALIFLLLIPSVLLGAVSDDKDIYLRRDVFEAKMDAFMAEIRLSHEQIRREMQEMRIELHNEIQDVKTELKDEINKLDKKVEVLSERVSGVEKGMARQDTTVYWILGMISFILGVITLIPALKALKEIFSPSMKPEEAEKIAERVAMRIFESKMNIS